MFIKQSSYDAISSNQSMRSNVGIMFPVLLVLFFFGAGLYFGIINNNVFDFIALLCYFIALGIGFYFVWLVNYTHKQFHSEYPASTPQEWLTAPHVPVIFPMLDGEAIIIDHSHMYYKSKAFISRFISSTMRMMLNISFIVIVVPLLAITILNHQYEAFILLLLFFSSFFILLYLVLLYPSYTLFQKSISWAFNWENIEDNMVNIKNPHQKGFKKVLAKETLKHLSVDEARREDVSQNTSTTYHAMVHENPMFYALKLHLDAEQACYTLLVSDNKDELVDFQQCFLNWIGS